MFADMGYRAFIINRIDYQLKTAWQQSQGLEFVWHGSASRGTSVGMWTHVLDSHYSSPWTFNFEYPGAGDVNTFSAADVSPPIYVDAVSEFTPSNVAERADAFAQEVQCARRTSAPTTC